MTDYFLTTLKFKGLLDFYHLFTNLSEVNDIIKQVEGIIIPLEVSRVRQAWTGVKDAVEAAAVVKKRGLEQEDMDALLQQEDLDDLQDCFWARYHMKYHPTVEPSDYLVSKCAKRMIKRLLSVDDIW